LATAAERSRSELARLHVITHAGSLGATAAAVEQVLAGGAPLVQLRVKEGTDRCRWQLAADVATLCRAAGAQLVVNDRADIAAGVGADGVHLGADDLPVSAARVVVGPAALIGATCRDADQARRAENDGADYLGVGPAFATSTKSGLPEALGPAGVGRVARAVGIPVIAIGGVTAERTVALLEAGAWGVAVCGSVYSATDPRAAVEALVRAVGSGTVGIGKGAPA
jgi:thiamine-phosphate pyrophosphorylase